jgi:trimeric autotransporter adhesin
MAMAKAKKALSLALAALFAAGTIFSAAPAVSAASVKKAVVVNHYNNALANIRAINSELLLNKDLSKIENRYEITKQLKAYQASMAKETNATKKAALVRMFDSIWAAYQRMAAEDFAAAKAAQEVTVVSVAAPADVTVENGAAFVAPKTVEATMSDNTKVQKSVAWDKTVDTKVAGVTTLTANVGGKTVSFKVTVKIGAVAVKSVSVTASNKMKVVFNQAVDTAKATFVVKNGSFLVPVNAGEWNADKTEVTLTKTFAKFLAGDYTVAVNGLGIEAGKETTSTKVEEERIEKIEVTTDKLIKTGAATATVSYKVSNQYGEDITKTATLSGVSSIGTVGAVEGTATVTKGSAFVDTDKVATVTLYTGVKSVTATVNIVDAKEVSKVTLGEMVLPKDTVRLAGAVTGVKVNYTAVDQYGNDVKFAATADMANLTFVYGTGVSNARIGTDPQDATKKALLVDVAAVDVETTATVTVIVNKTGAPSTTSFKLYPVAAPANFTLTPDTATIKAGTAYKVWVDAVDTYGEVVKADALAGLDANFSILSLNTEVFTVAADTIKYDATAKKAYIEVTPVKAGSSANLVVTLKVNGKNATLPVAVNAASEIVGMTLASNVFNFADGASAKVKATFVDQYNNEVKDLAGYTVEFTTSDATVIAKPADATIAQLVAGVSITPEAGLSNKTAKLTVVLKKTTAPTRTVDSQEIAVKVIEAAKTTLTYQVTDVAKLNGLAAADATSAYAKKLELTAKDSSGNTIYVPNSVIKSVTSTNDALVVAEKQLDGSYVISGLKAGITTGTEATASLTVIIENYDGTISIAKKDVTVSKAALVPTTLKVLKADGKTEITEIDVTAASIVDGVKVSAANAADATFKFEVKDQYGVVVEAGNYVVTNNTTGATIAISATGVIDVTGTVAADKSFNITVITSNGLTKTLKVTTK